MAFDIDIDKDKDIRLDDSNDIALVSGRERALQSIAISALDETFDLVGGRVTGKKVGQLEEALRRGLNDDNDVKEVLAVELDTYDRNDNRIEGTAVVKGEDNFNFEVTL